jgi:hypothetical protein
MASFFLFAKEGYGDEYSIEFETRNELENYIIKKTEENERCETGFKVVAVVHGEELTFDIVQKETVIRWN